MLYPLTWRYALSGLCLPVIWLVAAGAPEARAETGGPSAAVAWFTDARIDGVSPKSPPEQALPLKRGAVGKGVRLSQAVPVENPLLRRESGAISFWVKPDWDGNDGERHVLLRIGSPERNGLLVEKSARNMLRYVMASSQKVSASRADVSHWRSGDWHQVTVAWTSRGGSAHGLPLFLDEHLSGRGGPEPVDGSLAQGNTFLDPETMRDRRVWIGDETSGAVMDELIMRTNLATSASRDLATLVYRDYYRTAPFESILIDHAPNHARSDYRVVVGHSKQFGLRARTRGDIVPLTDFTAGNNCWGVRDARSFIRWETSDPKIAAVDGGGRVTGVAPGSCTLSATFRGLKATYDLDVAPVERADLSILWLSRLPRLRGDAAKSVPASGDKVRTVAHIGNYGFKIAAAGVEVLFELIPDTNRNFRLDEGEEPHAKQHAVISTQLKPYGRAEVTFEWTWPDEPMWVRVTVDPGDQVEEICEANNDRFHLTTARPARVRLDARDDRRFHSERRINLVGSFCYVDYAQAQFEALDKLLRDAVHPTTSPVGVHDSHYIDAVYETVKEDDTAWKAFEADAALFQAFHTRIRGARALTEQNSTALRDAARDVLKLQGLQGYATGDVMLADDGGRLYAETGAMPPLELFGPAPSGPYYDSLMDASHIWLHPASAGTVHYYGGYSADDRLGDAQCRLLPTRRSVLDLCDVDDGPLANAAIYVYQVTRADGLTWTPGRPKFVGVTDGDGQFVFPGITDVDWDDPRTDDVEGAVPVSNPFGGLPGKRGRKGDASRTSDDAGDGGVLFVKVVSAGKAEFHCLTDTDFREAFFAGRGPEGRVTVNTSLVSAAEPTPVVRQEVPKPLRMRNLRPIVSLGGPISVTLGGDFTLDATESRDPEGQRIGYYRWTLPEGARVHEGAVISNADALDLGGSFTIALWVMADSDGEVLAKTALDGSWVRGGKKLYLRGGELCFEARGVGHLAAGRRITGSGWRHVAVVYEKVARALRLYLDGEQVAERKFGMTGDVPGHCVVMGRGFRGAADELRIYGCALSRAEVRRLTTARASKAGLVGHWSFDELDGVGLADSSGRGAEGLLESARRIPGRVGGAIQFDGADWRFSNAGTVTLTAPANFDRLEASVRVYDGLRWSEAAKRVIVPDLDQEPRRPERLRKTSLRQGLRYSYYEGTWSSVRRLERARPMSTGIAPTVTMKPSRREENFALRFTGFIDAPKDGMYVFYTTSDDGSLLYVGDEIVVDNDGHHGAEEKCGAVALGKGLHEFTVHYAQGGGDRRLDVNWEGPGVKKGAIPAEALFHRR